MILSQDCVTSEAIGAVRGVQKVLQNHTAMPAPIDLVFDLVKPEEIESAFKIEEEGTPT